jgi:hypothetical protein
MGNSTSYLRNLHHEFRKTDWIIDLKAENELHG